MKKKEKLVNELKQMQRNSNYTEITGIDVYGGDIVIYINGTVWFPLLDWLSKNCSMYYIDCINRRIFIPWEFIE